MQGRWAHLEIITLGWKRESERGHILCLPWRVCKVVKIMCKMSLNPLKHRFLSFFLVPPLPLLLLCPAYSAAAAVRFLLDYFDCVIVLKLWYNFYSLFHSLSISLAASQRASAVFFKLFSLFAVFGATLSPLLPPCNTSIFVLAFFSLAFFPFLFARLWCQSKQFLPFAFLRAWLFIFGCKKDWESKFQMIVSICGWEGGWKVQPLVDSRRSVSKHPSYVGALYK